VSKQLGISRVVLRSTELVNNNNNNNNNNSVALGRERTIPSDRRLSAKLELTFADRGCRVVSCRSPTVVISVF
jgi:hypothetical protein